MFIKLLKSKLHRARVTDAKLHYAGSLAVDSELMAEVGFVPYESVMVVDVDNGSRLETYIIPAEAGSKKIEILGAAAHLVKAGDTVIIFSFAYLHPEEVEKYKPQVVALDESNNVIKTIS